MRSYRNQKQREYKDGYRGKISYWTSKLKDSMSRGNFADVLICNDKINYFIGRQLTL